MKNRTREIKGNFSHGVQRSEVRDQKTEKILKPQRGGRNGTGRSEPADRNKNRNSKPDRPRLKRLKDMNDI